MYQHDVKSSVLKLTFAKESGHPGFKDLSNGTELITQYHCVSVAWR